MGRKRDRFWDYAMVEPNNRFKCNYCNHVFSGGASRIKSHLAGVKGCDILICDAVPEDVKNEAYEATQGIDKRLKSASTSSNANTAKQSKIPSSTSTSKANMGKFVTQSKEEYMAEIVLDDAVNRLVIKAFSLATERFIIEWGFKEEMKNLLDTLHKIKVVLHQKRQGSDESVRIWLMKLRDVANEVDNVLDEFGYEIIQQKVQLQNQIIDQVHGFSFYKLDKVKQSLDKLVNEVAGFGLGMELVKSIIKTRLDKNRDSFLNDSEVVGREFDVVKILNKLFSSSSQQVLSVLPIVGMAGLGKTTIAKLVYNHEEIKKHFDVLTWVRVGENFDVEEISREIRKSLKKDLPDLGRKKCFLVLDDIWNEDRDKWGILRNYLVGINSNMGFNIIVTTCSDKVARIMGTLPPHHLEKLSKDDCWSILKKRAFADEGKSLTLDLEASGREIAKRCRGVPLAARVLGGTMCFKCNKNEWLAVQNNKIWDLLNDDNSDIFPVLKLCFDHLPIPSLKKCFAYCAIFPKDYDMKKDEVIEHWMAEGFLEPSKEGNMEMEDIGNMYFNILLATSFYQNARKDVYGNIVSCKMHDLMHDLALSISKSETLILEEDSGNNVSHVRNLFVGSIGKTTPRISFIGDGFMKLCTLVSKNAEFGNILLDFKSLRVLKLYGDNIKELPDSISVLIHLRLLHILHTDIKELPKSITKLYNLLTLRIEDCCYPVVLPKDISNLVNLRHIYLDHFKNLDNSMHTPRNIGQLTCLQTLPFFVVDLDEGCRIKELGCLKQLRGEIDIYNLEYVRNEEEARSANLAEKAKLFKLGFHWGADFGRKDDGYDKDEEVLEGLQPHRNLKSLTIKSYEGKKFPSWMLTSRDAGVGLSLYDNLIEINLKGCSKCEEVPTLGHLPYLRVLEMEGMENVRCIGNEFYSDGSYGNVLFPALRRLELKEMKSLEVWKDANELTTAFEVFPSLEELMIEDCDQLTIAPCHFPSLKNLTIDSVSRTAFEKITSKCTALVSVVISFVSGLSYIPKQLFQNNTNLKSLEIRYCDSLVSISPHQEPWTFYTSLQSLKIFQCKKLSYLLDSMPTFVSLQTLVVQHCSDLRSLQGFPSLLQHLEILRCGIEVLPGLQSCRSLQYLVIEDCHNLKSIPDLGEELHSLTQLKIRQCSNLISIPNLRDLRSLIRLEIWDCPNLISILDLPTSHSFAQLTIVKCGRLKLFQEGLLNYVTCLKTLRIGQFCEEMDAFPSFSSTQDSNTSLEYLDLYGWTKLNFLPEEIQCLTALTSLGIYGFDGMEALPEWLGNLTSLQELYLVDCKNLIYLPTEEAMRRLTKLKRLHISHCLKLNHELSKIGHIPFVNINNSVSQEDCITENSELDDNWEDNELDDN